MSNYAIFLTEDGNPREGLSWARRGAAATPGYANAQRTLGKVALSAKQPGRWVKTAG